jgi:phosphoribosylformylglycinamidine synthase
VLRKFLSSPNLASKEWVYRQYDHMVRTNTVQLPGGDAAVVRLKGTEKALAMSLDGNGRYCRRNPRRGAQIAVAEGCRNLVCVGALPLAVTNCLNFGNPQKPEIMWQFSEVIDGMAEACRVFETPVTGGNVSLYNETLGEGIYPTPVIGIVGLIEPITHTTGCWFTADGQVVALLGQLTASSGEYQAGLEQSFNEVESELRSPRDAYTLWASRLPCPPLDLQQEQCVQRACLEGIQNGLVRAAHDCSDGGLAVALAEMSFSSFSTARRGVCINLAAADFPAGVLFGEYQSRILVTLDEAHWGALQKIAAGHGVELLRLGTTGGNRLTIQDGSSILIDEPVVELESIWRHSLGQYFQR